MLLAVATNELWIGAAALYLWPVLSAKGYGTREQLLFAASGILIIFPAFTEACDCLVLNARPASLSVWLKIVWGLAAMFAYDAARSRYIDLGTRVVDASTTACLWVGSVALVCYAFPAYCRWVYHETALRLSRPRI